MSSFPILDLVVGMIFIYFLLSIICSSAVEIILSANKIRAKVLEKWLCRIFSKEVTIDGKTTSLGTAIMDHCTTTALSKTGRSTSYMDAKNFTSALLEKITYDPSKPLNIPAKIQDLVESIQKSDLLPLELKRVFLMYANEAMETFNAVKEKVTSEVDLFRGKIENWFDTSMQRVSGSFKSRYMRPWTFFVAALAAILLNADSMSIAKYLYSNPDARVKLASQAMNDVKDSALQHYLDDLKKSTDFTRNDSVKATFEQIQTNISERVSDIKIAKQSLEDVIPLGWDTDTWNKTIASAGSFLLKLLGLVLTVFAIMMGAPFWFDTLNKISNLRGTGNKPQTTADKDGK
jgi:hypothetical protein